MDKYVLLRASEQARTRLNIEFIRGEGAAMERHHRQFLKFHDALVRHLSLTDGEIRRLRAENAALRADLEKYQNGELPY